VEILLAQAFATVFLAWLRYFEFDNIAHWLFFLLLKNYTGRKTIPLVNNP
jgi:hypothetical protein